MLQIVESGHRWTACCCSRRSPRASAMAAKGDFAMAPDGRLTRRGERQIVPFAFAGVSLCDAEAVRGRARREVLVEPVVGPGARQGAASTACGSTGTGCMSARQRRWPRPRPGSSTKVPDAAARRPRLYTIPPSAPFLTTLARAVLNGDLPAPGGAKPDPLTLPRAIIYLPTRRAGRALREAFLDASGGRAAAPALASARSAIPTRTRPSSSAPRASPIKASQGPAGRGRSARSRGALP